MSDALESILSCEALRVSVPGRCLVDALQLDLRRGELVAVLGQNGSGKTLTLMTLAGLRPPDTGRVRLMGADLHTAPRQLTAQHLALLPQDVDDIFPATVMDTALIGRHPHIGRFRWESAEDYEAAETSQSVLEIAFPIVLVLLLVALVWFVVRRVRRRKASQVLS